jgi:hypothetical protein
VDDENVWIWRGKPKTHVCAILRIDVDWFRIDDPESPDGLRGIDITEVLPTYEMAEAEAARLNALNGGKGYRYYAMTTRFYPEGRSGS